MTTFAPFAFAQSPTYANARVVIFGANTTMAGHAPTLRGDEARKRKKPDPVWSASAIRQYESRSRSLSEGLLSGQDVFDQGNVQVNEDLESQLWVVEEQYSQILADNKIPLCLGGDHLVKYAGLRAVARARCRFGIVYLDAHPDCRIDTALQYDTVLHHVFVNGLVAPSNCALVGLREVTADEADGLLHYDCPIVPGSAFYEAAAPALAREVLARLGDIDSLYLSVDPDVINPAEVSAVEQPCAGGPLLEHVLAFIRALARERAILACDITEHIPRSDQDGRTASAMSRIVKEVAAASIG